MLYLLWGKPTRIFHLSMKHPSRVLSAFVKFLIDYVLLLWNQKIYDMEFFEHQSPHDLSPS